MIYETKTFVFHATHMKVSSGSRCSKTLLINVESFLQDECRLGALLGTWSGHSVTRRSGVYGSTLVEEDTLVTFTLEDNGNLIQVIFQLFDVFLMHNPQ